MFFFFKQKTAYDMRISDCSSDVCSSDLLTTRQPERITSRRTFARPPRRARRKESIHHDHRQQSADTRVRKQVQGHLRRPTLGHRPGWRSWRNQPLRSEERRVGKESVSTGSNGWEPHRSNNKEE